MGMQCDGDAAQWGCSVMGMQLQQLTDLEQTLQDIGQSKVRSQLLISDVELGLSQPFSPEADIPLFQLLLESLQAC